MTSPEARVRRSELSIAPCSMWDLSALHSPLMRAKRPRNQAVLKIRGFLRCSTCVDIPIERQTSAAALESAGLVRRTTPIRTLESCFSQGVSLFASSKFIDPGGHPMWTEHIAKEIDFGKIYRAAVNPDSGALFSNDVDILAPPTTLQFDSKESTRSSAASAVSSCRKGSQRTDNSSGPATPPAELGISGVCCSEPYQGYAGRP